MEVFLSPLTLCRSTASSDLLPFISTTMSSLLAFSLVLQETQWKVSAAIDPHAAFKYNLSFRPYEVTLWIRVCISMHFLVYQMKKLVYRKRKPTDLASLSAHTGACPSCTWSTAHCPGWPAVRWKWWWLQWWIHCPLVVQTRKCKQHLQAPCNILHCKRNVHTKEANRQNFICSRKTRIQHSLMSQLQHSWFKPSLTKYGIKQRVVFSRKTFHKCLISFSIQKASPHHIVFLELSLSWGLDYVECPLANELLF